MINRVKRAMFVLASVLIVIGLFWAGRESSHGLGAFVEHWWCPLPLVAIVAGLGCGLGALRRNSVL
jgi:hypothetical protein